MLFGSLFFISILGAGLLLRVLIPVTVIDKLLEIIVD